MKRRAVLTYQRMIVRLISANLHDRCDLIDPIPPKLSSSVTKPHVAPLNLLYNSLSH